LAGAVAIIGQQVQHASRIFPSLGGSILAMVRTIAPLQATSSVDAPKIHADAAGNVHAALGGQLSNLGLPVAKTTSAPLEAALRVFHRWLISDTEQAHILGYAVPFAGQHGGMTLDLGNRSALVLDIYESVYTLLKDAGAERAWIRTPRADLEDHSVLDLIRAQAYVDDVNGR
jgi:hypothetical protein